MSTLRVAVLVVSFFFAFGHLINRGPFLSFDSLTNKFVFTKHAELILAADSASTRRLTNPINVFAVKYNQCLTDYPILTKVVSSVMIGGIGDILIQIMSQQSLDYRRLLVFTAVAGLYFAPVIDIWFSWLNSLPLSSEYSGNKRAFIMLLIDQTVGSILVNGGFFVAFELIQRMIPPYGSSGIPVLQAAIDAIYRNLWSTMKANWCCWPFVNFINFRLVPVQYRLLFSNFAAVFWNMYLSMVANA